MISAAIKGRPLYQWDTGRKVIFAYDEDFEEVHFSNNLEDNALIVVPKDGEADIPNILLQEAKTIYVYTVHTNETGEETRYDFKFSVKARSKPSDYIYTETEVKSFQWDNIEGKPFYKTGSPGGEILSEITLDESMTDNAEEGSPFYLQGTTPMTLEIDKTYTVTWNGVPYECTCTEMVDDGFSACVLGDLGLMSGGVSSGEPFIIVALPSEMVAEGGFYAMVLPLDGSTEATLSISFEGDFAEKLNNECLDLEWLPIRIPEKELLPKTTVTTSGTKLYGLTSKMFTDGEKVIVEFDNKKYTFTTTIMEDFTAFGNGYFFNGSGSDNGLPFLLTVLGSYSTISFGDSEEHTIGVYIPDKGYRYDRLPDGCIPSKIENTIDLNPTSERVVIVDENGKITASKVTLEDLKFIDRDDNTIHNYQTQINKLGSYKTEGNVYVIDGTTYTADDGATVINDINTNKAIGMRSLVAGHQNIALRPYQAVIGMYNDYNVPDALFVIGNGNNAVRKNVHTVNHFGNAWYAGTIEGTALILKSSTRGSDKRFKITVDDNGTLSATEIVEATEVTETTE